MKIKCNKKYEEFDNKTFKLKFEPENTAFITHYLQNHKNGIKITIKNRRLNILIV